MEALEGATTMERMLLAQAKQSHTPVNGSIELLPLCNMNCDMCYVRLSREEMERQGRLRTGGGVAGDRPADEGRRGFVSAADRWGTAAVSGFPGTLPGPAQTGNDPDDQYERQRWSMKSGRRFLENTNPGG